MSTAPVATRYTYEFVRRSLPAGATRVLEIGCGAGELAARLQQDGLEVVAIDSDVECVAAARGAGIDARHASWPAAIEGAFDAVLFTRSLHHIHPLDDAVAAARDALRPGGRVIVEDFRAEGGSQRSTGWFGGLVSVLHTAEAFTPPFNMATMLAKLDVADDHHLHASTALHRALGSFAAVAQEDAAYYFRYLEAELDRPATVEAVLAHELELIGVGAIDPLGKRFVAHD